MGMRITAVHRGISFNQSPWMEPYIRKNTELRETAANSFEKDFSKLMNNSVFGKTIENIRKRQNIFLIDNRKKASKLTSRPSSKYMAYCLTSSCLSDDILIVTVY